MGKRPSITDPPPLDGVEFVYGLNISRCIGCRKCVHACVAENNQSRSPRIEYIRVLEMNKGSIDLESSDHHYDHEQVPDPNKYYMTIFGTPSDESPWGMSFEGHHLSLNFVCRDGKVVDSTPQFFAANPATIMNEVAGPLGKGTRVLRQEEDLAFQLVNSLSDAQKESAIIAETAPKEIRFAGEPQATVGEPEGIAQRDLDNGQKKLLTELVYTYVNAVADKVAAQRRELIDHNGWENSHFAWAGATDPGIGHYYRIRGTEFLIEFVNTQPDAAGNPANHIHSVWRDLGGDFDLPIK